MRPEMTRSVSLPTIVSSNPRALECQTPSVPHQCIHLLGTTQYSLYTSLPFLPCRQALSDFITASVSLAACLNPGQGGRPEELDITNPSVAFSSNWGTEVLAQAVNTLSADLSIVSGGLPELGLKDKAQQLVAGACQHHMALCFLAMTSRITCAVAAVQLHASGQGHSHQGQGGAHGSSGMSDGSYQGGLGSSGQVYRKGYAFLVDLVARGLEALMQGLKTYEAHPRLLSNNFPDFMHNLQVRHQAHQLIFNHEKK